MKQKDTAVAVGYSGAGSLPEILAVARGALVERLLGIAREHGITVYRDADLAEVLSKLDVGSEIPEGLFAAVAEVLAYCYRVNAGFAKKMDTMMQGAGSDA